MAHVQCQWLQNAVKNRTPRVSPSVLKRPPQHGQGPDTIGKIQSGVLLRLVVLWLFCIFFPRASECRVLPIVGVCKTSSHLHIFFHICSSSHLLSHLLIFTSAHLHIFSHICSSSHLLIFTSSLPSAHLHICSSSHLLSHLLIFTSSLTSSLTSAHLHICSCPHLLSHLLLFSPFSLSCLFSLLPFLSLAFFIFLSLGGSRGSGNETPRNATLSHEMRFDRQKLR